MFVDEYWKGLVLWKAISQILTKTSCHLHLTTQDL